LGSRRSRRLSHLMGSDWLQARSGGDARRERPAGVDRGAVADFGLDLELTTQELRALAHAGQAETPGVLDAARLEARSAVRDAEPQSIAVCCQLYTNVDAAAVPCCVRQRLLQRAQQRDLDSQRRLFRQPFKVSLDVDTRATLVIVDGSRGGIAQ